jgi:GNAT superfamily N-acetyltransferase
MLVQDRHKGNIVAPFRYEQPYGSFRPLCNRLHRDIVQTIVDNYNIASTGQAECYPVAFFLQDENGEILGGLLGDIWAAWLHVRTLAVAMPARGHGFGKELIKRAELYAIERGCTDAYLDTFSFQARPFYEKLGYHVFGTLENHPFGHQHYFMTKKLDLPNNEKLQNIANRT